MKRIIIVRMMIVIVIIIIIRITIIIIMVIMVVVIIKINLPIIDIYEIYYVCAIMLIRNIYDKIIKGLPYCFEKFKY